MARIVVGLIAGWLAGQVMKGGGYGVLIDIVLGIVGGLVGGWIFGQLGIWPGGGMMGSIIVAFIGAVILVGVTRRLKSLTEKIISRSSTPGFARLVTHFSRGCMRFHLLSSLLAPDPVRGPLNFLLDALSFLPCR